MAGTKGHSGRHPLPIETHLLRGTFRPHRHAKPNASHPVAVSDEERRGVLRGLRGDARRTAARLMDSFSNWDPASLSTLHSYCRSCERLKALEHMAADDTRVHREVRTNLRLWAALRLDARRIVAAPSEPLNPFLRNREAPE